MNTDVLLVVDNSERELVGIFLIKQYLRELGFSSKICSRFTLTQAFHKFRPKTIVLPNAGFSRCQGLMERCFVCVLPSESGNGQHAQVLGIMKGSPTNKCYTGYVDMFFSWGEQMTKWLVEEKVYSKERIRTTGHPSTDHWLLPVQKKLNRKAGLTTTFRMLSNSMGGVTNAIKWIYQAEKSGGDGSFYLPPEHAETWIYWEAAFLRLICNILDYIVIPHNIRIELRPHHIEMKEPYEFLVKQSKGLMQVFKEGTISEWFQNIDVLLTYMSASALDAVVKGFPVISLKKILNQDALQRIPYGFRYDYYDYLWQAESLDQLKEFIEDAFWGRLQVSPNPDYLKEYIYRHFHFPRKKPSACLVAEGIADLMENNRPRKFRPLHDSSSVKFWLYTTLNYVPYSTELVMGFRHIEDYFRGINASGGPRRTYLPWRWRNMFKARNSASKIFSSCKDGSNGM